MLDWSIRSGSSATLVLAWSLGAATVLAQAPSADPVTPTQDVEAKEPSRQALIADGEAPDLFLLYTGDVIGYLDPCG